MYTNVVHICIQMLCMYAYECCARMHTNVVHVCIQMPMRACTTLYTLILITSILCNAAGYAYTDPAVLYRLASNRETLSVSGSIFVQLQQIYSWVQQGLVIGNKLTLPRFIFNGEEERREEYKGKKKWGRPGGGNKGQAVHFCQTDCTLKDISTRHTARQQCEVPSSHTQEYNHSVGSPPWNCSCALSSSLASLV